MTIKRFFFIVSALLTAAFLALVVHGLTAESANDPGSHEEELRAAERDGLARAIDGLSRETFDLGQ